MTKLGLGLDLQGNKIPGSMAAAGPSWSPNDDVTNTTLLFLDGFDESVYTFSSGSSISIWADKSGLNNHASQGNATLQPLRTGVMNTTSVPNFPAGDSRRFDLTADIAVTDAVGVTVLALISPDSTGDRVFISGTSSAAFESRVSSDNKITVLRSHATDTGSFTTALTNGTDYVVAIKADTLDRIFSLGGVADGTNTTDVSTFGNINLIGCGWDGANRTDFFRGTISWIAIWQDFVSDVELDAGIAYLLDCISGDPPGYGGGGGGGGGPVEGPTETAKRLGTSRPFAEDGPWNTTFTGSEVWYDSATLRTLSPAEQSDLGLPTNERHWYWAETSVKVWVTNNSDPLWTCIMPDYIYLPFNRNRSASTFTFHGPTGMVENQDADHILVVYNSDTGELFEVWQAETTDSPLAEGLAQQADWEKQTLGTRTITNRIFSGSVAPGWARSNIMFDPGAGTTIPGGTNDGTRASNFSWLAGLLTERDFDNGVIDHAMVISLGYVTLDNSNWTAPATAPDNGGHSGPLWMGDRIGIPPGEVAPGTLSATGLMVWNCLQDYGAYVGDFAGSAYPIFYLDENMVPAYDAELRHLFVWFDGYEPDMDIIIPYLRVADRDPGA